MKITSNDRIGSPALYLQILKAICGNTAGKSVLDLCCCKSPHVPQLGFEKRTYVDIQDWGLDFPEEQLYFFQRDVFNFLNDCEHFDVAVISDGIEHFTKAQGITLLFLMQSRSAKQIIFTPLGDYLIEKKTTDNPDSHKSGWLPKDFPGWGIIELANFHPTLGIGAFFSWHCEDMEEDFKRVSEELKDIL